SSLPRYSVRSLRSEDGYHPTSNRDQKNNDDDRQEDRNRMRIAAHYVSSSTPSCFAKRSRFACSRISCSRSGSASIGLNEFLGSSIRLTLRLVGIIPARELSASLWSFLNIAFLPTMP